MTAISVSKKTEQPTIIIIIDDLGHNLELGIKAINLPGQINYAILPHTTNAKTLADAANAANKEVLLHLPMANQQLQPLGPGGLTIEMKKQDFLKTLRDALKAIPHVRGVNNHMGSQLTTLPKEMKWLMEELAKQNLYFLDSRTSAKTVAAETAQYHGVPSLSRNIFLDNNPELSAIEKQFKKLLRKASKEGIAVGIGHPYTETLNYLEKVLPTLENQGFELVLASEAMEKKEHISALF
tara:strand:+ start:615 stop:1331 length:717 start_codon:yes stop_codon:yes gene_type:complete